MFSRDYFENLLNEKLVGARGLRSIIEELLLDNVRYTAKENIKTCTQHENILTKLKPLLKIKSLGREEFVLTKVLLIRK